MAKFCPNCGAQLNDDATFCPSCGAKQSAPQQSAPQQAAPQQKSVSIKLPALGKKIENPLFILGAIISAIVVFFIKLTPALGVEGGNNMTLFYAARNDFIDKTALYVFMMIFYIIMACTAAWLCFKHFVKKNVTDIDMIIAFAGMLLMFIITVIAFPVIGGELDFFGSSGPNVGGWILLIGEIAGLFFTAFPVIKEFIKK